MKQMIIRSLSILLWSGAWGILCHATISVSPGPIEDRFAKSDLVCICEAKQIGLAKPPTYTGPKLATADYDSVIHIIQALKGTPVTADVSVAFSNVDPMRGAPVRTNSKYLLFLKHQPNGEFQLSDESGVVALPPDFALEDASGGLKSLEIGLADGLRKHGGDNEEFALMDVLLQFSSLSGATVSHLELLSSGPASKLALMSLEALCRAGVDPARYVPRLISMLVQLEATAPAELDDLGPELSRASDIIADNTTATDLAGLKQLADSHIRPLRLCSMLAIRRLHDPGTVPFLVTALDSDDDMVQYEAVITLSEITRQGGDFAPGKGLFDRDPSKYKGMWKDWYQRQGGKTDVTRGGARPQ